MNKVWLNEPSLKDDSYAEHGEHTLDWLSRSTLPRAKQMKSFLNHNLSELPQNFADKLKQDLKNRWRTAFFELILGRLLQEIGLKFKHEKSLINGKKPDFLIKTSIGEIVLEATSPIINSVIGEFYKKANPLIEIIKEYAPENWIVNINNLPDIGLNDSKRPFKSFIKREFSKIQPIDTHDEISINKRFPDGKLELSLMFKPNYRNKIGIFPAVGYAENSKYRIEHIIDEKRTQLRKIEQPVILAIPGSSTGTDLNDFDQVLFGHTYEKMNRNFEVIETGFKPDGKFVSENKEPTYQAILAFEEVGFRSVKIPTM